MLRSGFRLILMVCFAAIVAVYTRARAAEPSPAPIPQGVGLWLRADAIGPDDQNSIRTQDGGRYVARWVDRSGAPGPSRDVSQDDPARQPVLVADAINGHPTVRFSRTRVDGLHNTQINLLDSGSARTVFVVARSSSGAGGGTLFAFRRGSDGHSPVFVLQQFAAGGAYYVWSDAVNDQNATTSSAIDAIRKPFLAAYRSEGAGSQIRCELNGVTQPVTGGKVSAETGLDGFVLGNREDSGARNEQGWDGDIAEVLVYGRALSPAEIEQTSLYLAEKYKLPTAYKSLRLPPAATARVDFRRDVYPILSTHCFDCHKGADAKSGYRLDVREEILGETNGEPLVQKGDSAHSLLVHLVSGAVDGKFMPPKGKGEALTAEHVGILRAWIDQGLPWDEALLPSPTAKVEHWAFKPVVRPAVPGAKNAGWVRTPIDSFIATRQEARGIRPSGEASRQVLIRRLTLDLTGLPPTPAEVRAFEQDASPDAYDKLVDRLLASPRYGERWGRYWLDLARWADTEGYESNELRKYAWRYRDYVVRSFNDDKPWDRFVKEQIAGDELLPYSDENLIATGFVAAARYSSNEDDLALKRNDVLIDVVNATGSALLGLTVGCAQCHNHKFDPITQRDYFRLQGFFASGQQLNVMLADPAMKSQWEALHDQKAEKPQTFAFYSPLSPTALEVETLKAYKVLPYDAAEQKRAQAHLLVRGDIHRPGPALAPGWPAIRGPTPSVAGPASAGDSKLPRTVLANWLTDVKNPLVARVWVNRVWQWHFGRGLVDTPGDFGVRGSPPTHPELLDWLAGEFQQNGWSTKKLHRLIVLSSTYRQASRFDSQSAKLDPDNQLWWRWQPHRLEAEAIRDSQLQVTGELDTAVGGPPIAHSEHDKQFRRTLYLLQDRNDFPDVQQSFDGPASTESCPRRAVSTVPMQALYLLNHPFVLSRAKAFASRVMKEAGADPAPQIDAAFRLALGRAPDEKERAAGIAFLGQPPAPEPVALVPAAAPWEGAHWVWDNPAARTADQTSDPRYLRCAFELPAKPVSARVLASADDTYVLYVNGQRIGEGRNWQKPDTYDVASSLVAGKNV
ncbi:MAG: Planctomycete cytochrome, partial [Phycisphaerales bacterium]|nr:Planctomycete cytochrome [Phycisphaerales bacterium]